MLLEKGAEWPRKVEEPDWPSWYRTRQLAERTPATEDFPAPQECETNEESEDFWRSGTGHEEDDEENVDEWVTESEVFLVSDEETGS